MKRTTYILGVLIVADLVLGGAFWFGYTAISAKKDKETELRRELSDEARKVAQQAALRRALKQAESERGALAKYFYDRGEESQIKFVAELEALGIPVSGALVQTGSLSLATGGTPSFHGELTLKGEWEELHHFLRLLETFPARVIIRRFTAQQAGVVDGVEEWSGSLGIDLTSLKAQ
jgi:hypothetical protein